jgi:mannose-6-phosphate isomerase-like protein (cupin superfamily)
MSADSDSPYVTRMDILHGACEVIDLPALERACTHPWFNQTLCRVNESVVRFGVFEGEYHWHQHAHEDEFFFVVSGRLEIELEGADTVELGEHQGFVVPRGRMHRPVAKQRTVVLMVEADTIVPTGTPAPSEGC